MPKFIRVEPLAAARAKLSETIARINEERLYAEPVVIGRRYKPEAVLISFELYEKLADVIDEIHLTPTVAARLNSGEPGVEMSVEQLAESVGVDLDTDDTSQSSSEGTSSAA